jgi:hypothetical protein
MPELSLREAALRFRVSRATLAKDLANGKVSGQRDAAGNWRLDAAELARVYQPRSGLGRIDPAQSRPQSRHVRPAQSSGSGTSLGHEIGGADDISIRLARAEAELAAEREKVALLERHLDDVRRLLPSPQKPPGRRWWPW